jgi:group I intron endonuclease
METYGYIYLTTNKINEKSYIGKHKSKDWDYNYFGSGKILLYAIKKYGIENFTCFPLMWAWNKEELNKLEIEYIAHYKPEYNIAKGGEGGYLLEYASDERKEEARKKNSEAKKGVKRKPFSDKTRQKLSAINQGKKHTEETRKKLSEINKGRKHTEETKRKIGDGHINKHHSEETKRKIGEIHKGKIISDETRQKISEAQKGRKFSEETRQKMSDSRKGLIPWNKGKKIDKPYRKRNFKEREAA